MTHKKFVEDYDQFTHDLIDLHLKHGKIYVDKPWFDLVQDQHQAIRKELGEIDRTRFVNVTAFTGSIDKKVVDPLISELRKLIPDLAYNCEVRKFNTAQLAYPTVPIGSHKVIKTSKFIINTAREKGANLAEVNKIIAELGQCWSRAKSEDGELKVSLLTNAMSFLRLGHYEVDKDSCFKNTSENADHKKNLAVGPNTFVILLEEDDKIVGRFWGFVDEKFKIWNVCNFYFDKKVHEGNILVALKHFFAELMDVEAEKLEIHEDKVAVDEGIYHNPYGSFSFTTQKRLAKSRLVWDIEKDENTCPTCLAIRPNRNKWGMIDGEECCDYCFATSRKCDISDEKTFEDLFPVIDKNGKKCNCKRSLLHEFVVCNKCGLRCHEELISLNQRGQVRCVNCIKIKENEDNEDAPSPLSPRVRKLAFIDPR